MPAYEKTASFQVRLVINDIKLIALVHRDISGNLLQVFVQSFFGFGLRSIAETSGSKVFCEHVLQKNALLAISTPSDTEAYSRDAF